MKAKERRNKILNILSSADEAISGKVLAERLNVSRQVIVQDIALLRANGENIISTNLGYVCPKPVLVSRVFKTNHTDEQTADEMQTIVDCGGIVKDVFVYHKIYGVVQAELNIRSRSDIERFVDDVMNGKSTLLKNITSNYHYHTVLANSEETLSLIQTKLYEKGYLASLTDYEPVDFWE